MDKLVDRLLQLDDFFVFVAPGLVLELSLLLWFPTDSGVLRALSDHTILAAVLAVIVAAAIGLIVLPTPGHVEPGSMQYSLEQRLRLGLPEQEDAQRLFQRADAAHLRFQLSRGLGLAFGLLAAQIVLRFVLAVAATRFLVLQSIVYELPRFPSIGLGILAVVAGFAALMLRRRARFEFWLEQRLTSEIYPQRNE
jgi:hypothetical protein